LSAIDVSTNRSAPILLLATRKSDLLARSIRHCLDELGHTSRHATIDLLPVGRSGPAPTDPEVVSDRLHLQRIVRDHELIINLLPDEIRPRTTLGHLLDGRERRRQRAAIDSLVAILPATSVRRLVQRSSAHVYADGGHQLVDETQPLRKMDLGEPQSRAEYLGHDLRDRGRDGVTLRLARIYDAADPDTRRLIQLAHRGWEPLLGPDDVFNPTVHLTDAAQAFAVALTAPPGIYNVGDRTPATNKELNSILSNVVGRRLHSLGVDVRRIDKPLLADSCRLDARRFAATTDWYPSVPDVHAGLLQVARDIRRDFGPERSRRGVRH
jgi:nucleoside-diphosphate-sugar epimerase